MNLKELPQTFEEWLIMRKKHLDENLEKGKFTIDLYKQYKKHLGIFRYNILLEAQKLVVPDKVKKLLNLGKFSLLKPSLVIYKGLRKVHLDSFLKNLILPHEYKKEIAALDIYQ
jgi:hypothetical protein